MQRLSGVDTVFLALDGPGTVGHLVLLVVVQGDLAPDALRSRVADRVPDHPVLGRRLVTTPGGVGRPYWLPVQPRLEDHLSEGALPDDWTLAELAEAGLALARRALPRDRPLWRMDLLRSPAGGRSVLAVTVHHAAADGLAVRDLVAGLCDDPDLPAAAEPVRRPDTLPPAVRRWAGVLDLPLATGAAAVSVAAKIPGTAAVLPASLTSRLRAGRSPRAGAERRALHGKVGAERSLALGEVSLAAARALRGSHGASVNDVVLAATAGALRRLLVELGHEPSGPVHAVVPISRRATGVVAQAGNSLALALCPLPVHEPSPERRLEAVRLAMLRARSPSGLLLDDSLVDALSRLAVPAVATPAVRLATRLGLGSRAPLPVDLMVSNVAGPARPGSIAGHRIEALYPVPLVADGLGLNVTVHGCGERLHYAVASAPGVVHDPGHLVALVEEEHAQLAALVG